MAYSTEIANFALGHIGVNSEIQDLETEQSREAKAIRRFWDNCLQQMFEDHPYGFATKFADLTLIEEDPNTDWLYSYTYPTDCVYIRKILSGVNVTTPADPIDYKVGFNDDGRLILTNQEDAAIEYTRVVQDFDKMPAYFKMAFSYRLAMYIAPSLTSGDPFKIKQDCEKGYLFETSKAEANSINEESNDPDVDSEFVRARI
jgi:hypothetical protein